MLFNANLSAEGEARLIASQFAIGILCVLHVFGVSKAMLAFMFHILIDSCVRSKDHPLSIDMILHHSLGFLIVVYGLFQMHVAGLDGDKYIRPFLMMETTSPLLHLSWILYNDLNKKREAIPVFVVLMFVWVKFRIWDPTNTILEIFFTRQPWQPYYSYYYFVPSDLNLIAFPFFAVFLALQYYWFIKLLRILCLTTVAKVKEDKNEVVVENENV
jgi:hypothetical protein